jgi:putative lipoic acid-binding regulatory protein
VYSSRDTSSGKYRSLTIHAPVKSADQLYEIYEKVDLDPRVKFKF